MAARLLAFVLTMEGGKPEQEYNCLKKNPQLTMRTHVRALAAIVEHTAQNGDEDGAFAPPAASSCLRHAPCGNDSGRPCCPSFLGLNRRVSSARRGVRARCQAVQPPRGGQVGGGALPAADAGRGGGRGVPWGASARRGEDYGGGVQAFRAGGAAGGFGAPARPAMLPALPVCWCYLALYG